MSSAWQLPERATIPRFEAPQGTLVVVEPGTPLKWSNDSDRDALIFAYGAPAESKPEVLET